VAPTVPNPIVVGHLSRSERKLDIEELVPVGLPSGKDVVSEGVELAQNVHLGKSAFLVEEGAESELEFKLRLKEKGEISTHAQFGLNTVELTVQGLRFLHKEAMKNGIRIDRFGLCMNQVMGLPPQMRMKAPKGTGPVLWKEEDWYAIAQAAPIQPHFGDFMIGSPASVINTTLALRAGATTIGNLAQYFTFEYALWTDLVGTSVETVKALGMMAALKGKGALIHSYLDDGFGGLFTDYAAIAGWGMIERYIVERLIGGKLAHCFGGLTSDHMTRLAWQTVLDRIHEGETIGSMLYGDTISLTEDLDRNRANSASCAFFDILGQLRRPTAHAIVPVPKTEPIRIPSPAEVVEAHVNLRRMEKEARRLLPVVNFTRADALALKMFEGGRLFFESTLRGLKEAGVNVDDPLELLVVLRKIGASKLELLFGPGKSGELFPNGRKPVLETDLMRRTFDLAADFVRKVPQQEAASLHGVKVLVASTDVHGYALLLILNLLRANGAEIENLGPSVESTKTLVDAISELHPQVVVLTTHNGKALEYAKSLMTQMKQTETHALVIMGGKLNQNLGGELPVDVSVDLNRMGIVTSTNLQDIPSLISRHISPIAK
jgi:methylmalonyl-CoA mutase cobalamin-binding subunit